MPNYNRFHVNYYLKVTCNILLTKKFLGCFEYFNFKNLSTYMVSFSWTFCKIVFLWLTWILAMEKDFTRQQIDVKIQCFHVNELKMLFFFSEEKHINSTREIKNENNGRRVVICTWIAAITARIVTQAILFS